MTSAESTPSDFDALSASRRNWIDEVLRPWCRSMSLAELRKAEQEWFNIAGRVDAHATLWTWAWERFPAIVHPDLPGVNETHQVTVLLQDGRSLTGFPDNRESQRGQLIMVSTGEDGTLAHFGPISIDQITDITRPQADQSEENNPGGDKGQDC